MIKLNFIKNSIKGSLILILFVAFQNCGNVMTSSTLYYDSKNILANSSNLGAEFSWKIDLENKNFNINSEGFLENWIDSSSHQLFLLPPHEMDSILTFNRSGKYLSETKLNSIRFEDGNSMMTVNEQSMFLSSNKYTVLFYINNIKFSNTLQNRIRIVGLEPLDNKSFGNILIELSKEQENYKIELIYDYGELGQTKYISPIEINENENKGLSIGITVTENFNELAVSVNGKNINFSNPSKASISFLSFNPRLLKIHHSEADSTGSFDLYDLGIYRKVLGQSELNAFTSALLNTYYFNKKTPISELEGFIEITTKILTFSEIQQIFKKTINGRSCNDCHFEFNSRDELLKAQSISGPWVIPGNVNSSVLIKSIKHEANVEPMPKNGGSLSAEDINAIEDWINQGAQ